MSSFRIYNYKCEQQIKTITFDLKMDSFGEITLGPIPKNVSIVGLKVYRKPNGIPPTNSTYSIYISDITNEFKIIATPSYVKLKENINVFTFIPNVNYSNQTIVNIKQDDSATSENFTGTVSISYFQL